MAIQIYLGGPIHGLSHDETTSWREEVTKLLLPWECLSPLRPFHQTDDPTYSMKFDRDYGDMMACHAAFFNVLPAKKPSIGTICEIAWSYHRFIPTVLVMDEGNPNQNDFLIHCLTLNTKGKIVNTIAKGVTYLKEYFGHVD